MKRQTTWKDQQDNHQIEEYVLTGRIGICKECQDEYDQDDLDQNNICKYCRKKHK